MQCLPAFLEKFWAREVVGLHRNIHTENRAFRASGLRFLFDALSGGLGRPAWVEVHASYRDRYASMTARPRMEEHCKGVGQVLQLGLP